MKHCDHNCKHERVKYCEKCGKVYCEDCGKEWPQSEPYWVYPTYPIISYEPNYNLWDGTTDGCKTLSPYNIEATGSFYYIKTETNSSLTMS